MTCPQCDEPAVFVSTEQVNVEVPIHHPRIGSLQEGPYVWVCNQGHEWETLDLDG